MLLAVVLLALHHLDLPLDVPHLLLQTVGLVMAPRRREAAPFSGAIDPSAGATLPWRRSVVLRTRVMRAFHLFGLVKQPFCFALELFSLAELARIWLVSKSAVGNEVARTSPRNERHRESSHLKS